jgi:hypothetical protein
MTNSESLGAESATEPTTKPEQDALNMSAGAEMLIARMKTNPEDFRYNGRFYRVVGAIDAAGQGWISARDAVALKAAYEEHIQEAEFSEWVYNEIFSPKEPASPKMYTQNLAGSMMASQNAIAGGVLQGAFIDPRNAYGTSPLQGQLSSAGQGTMLQQIKTKIGL